MIVLFGHDIPLYGVMFSLGIIIAAATAAYICRFRLIKSYDIVYSSIYIFIGAITGAKLFFLAVSIKQIIEYKIPFLDLFKGGYVFYGGLLGGFLGLFIYAKQFKMEISKLIDIYSVVLPLGHAIGRIGCFLGGCCYGIECDCFISYTYKNSYDINTPIGIPLFPVQLVESALLFILFIILLTIFLKRSEKHIVPMTYLLAYSFIRFVLEFLRGDKERGMLFKISTSQWISIIIFFACLMYIIYKNIRKTKEKSK